MSPPSSPEPPVPCAPEPSLDPAGEGAAVFPPVEAESPGEAAGVDWDAGSLALPVLFEASWAGAVAALSFAGAAPPADGAVASFAGAAAVFFAGAAPPAAGAVASFAGVAAVFFDEALVFAAAFASFVAAEPLFFAAASLFAGVAP